MDDAEQTVPMIYREAAEQVREVAGRAKLSDIRSHLLELSTLFERLAVYAEAALRLGAPGFPHGQFLPIAVDGSLSQNATGPPTNTRPPQKSSRIQKGGVWSHPASRVNYRDQHTAEKVNDPTGAVALGHCWAAVRRPGMSS